MRNIIITFFLLFATHFATAQSGEIWRGAGVVYTLGQPNFDAHPKGAWIAIDTTSGYYWLWDKQAEDWVDGGGMIQPTGTTGAPSYTPDLQHSRFAINTGDSLFSYRGGSWRLINDAPDLSAYVTAATLDDSTAAIRADFPLGTDNQIISIDSVVGTDVTFYTATLEDGGTISWRDSFPSGGGVTGSGTTNEIPYWASSSSLGSLTTATYPSLLELSYIKGLSSSAQNQLNAKHGGSLTAGYVPYSSAGGYGLANSSIQFNGTNIGIGTTPSASSLYPLFIRRDQAAVTQILIYNSNTTSSSGARFRCNSGVVDGGFGSDYNTPLGLELATFTNHPLKFKTNDITRGVISNGGDFGIGQTTPTARLHVTGSSSTSLTELLLGEKSDGVDVIKANNGGQVAIGAGAYTTSTVLDVQSTTLVFAPPRMTTAQRNAISTPPNGGIIFCTDCTATDGSTGVSQTYSSSAWRNHY